MTVGSRLLLLGVIAAACMAAAAQVMVMAQLGGPAGFAVPVVVVVAIAVVRRPLLGLQLGLLTVPLEFFSFKVGGLVGFSATELLLLLCAAATLLEWAVLGRVPSVPPALRALALICVVIALGFAVARDTAAVTKVLLMWSTFTVIGTQLANAPLREVQRTLACMALAGGLVSLFAIATSGTQTLVAGGAAVEGRAQGSFSQPNTLGFFLLMTLPVAMVLATRGTAWLRTVMAVAAALSVVALLLSLSRTSLLGAGLSFLVLLLSPPFRRLAFVALAVLLVFAFANAKTLSQSHQVEVVTSRLGTLGEGGNAVRNDPRFKIYSAVPGIFADHPWLGVGAHNFPLVARETGLKEGSEPYDHAHNVVLTFAVELGIAGLIALCWLLLAVGRLVAAAVRTRGDPVTGALGLALTASMVGSVMTSLGDYPPRNNVVAATFIAQVGMLVALARAQAGRSA